MKRNQAKELLAYWIYLDRKEANLTDFGSSDGDQAYAERILSFFENEKDCYKGLDYASERDDYARFKCLYQLIEGENEQNLLG